MILLKSWCDQKSSMKVSSVTAAELRQKFKYGLIEDHPVPTAETKQKFQKLFQCLAITRSAVLCALCTFDLRIDSSFIRLSKAFVIAGIKWFGLVDFSSWLVEDVVE